MQFSFPLLAVEKLRQWFLANKRDLPWRQSPTPYAVWVSEVMLQQTQVDVVIDYFCRWMERFPTVEALAQAPLDAIIKAWEGLGYYSRARHLHEAAKQILAHHGGQLPADPTHLKQIKGIGPYTQGAILSFAFHQRVPAVDGNVIRALSRIFQIEQDVSKVATIRLLWQLAEKFLPQERPWEVAEALIELGALICQKVPRCHLCPLRNECRGYKSGKAHLLPLSAKKIAYERLQRLVAVVEAENHLLLRRCEEGRIMAGLHEFPYYALPDQNGVEHGRFLSEQLGLDLHIQYQLPTVKHSFTRYRATLYPYYAHVKNRAPVAGFSWVAKEELLTKAFSSGHRQILELLRCN